MKELLLLEEYLTENGLNISSQEFEAERPMIEFQDQQKAAAPSSRKLRRFSRNISRFLIVAFMLEATIPQASRDGELHQLSRRHPKPSDSPTKRCRRLSERCRPRRPDDLATHNWKPKPVPEFLPHCGTKRCLLRNKVTRRLTDSQPFFS
jgi:hypothetical protein